VETDVINNVIVFVFLLLGSVTVLVTIFQIIMGVRCKEKVEAILVEIEERKHETGSRNTIVPHESRYSKYSYYSYKPKKEYITKKIYSYTYIPTYKYEYNNSIYTRTPLNNLDFFENKAFEKKKYMIGQKYHIYINPKNPYMCLTKRFSLVNMLQCAGGLAAIALLIFVIVHK